MTSLFGGGSSVNVNASGTLVPQTFIPTDGQTVFNITLFSYTIGTNSLLVFINGTKQRVLVDFTETSTTSFTLTSPVLSTDTVEIIGFPLATLQFLPNASIISYTAAGAGAISRTVSSKLNEIVSVKDFGAVGDGVTDDTAAFTAAMNSLGIKGGVVKYSDKHFINSSLTVPASVLIAGDYKLVGTPGNNSSAQYGNLSSILLSSTATINLKSGAGLVSCLIIRSGMTFPAANSSAFAGTAVTAAGDDTFVEGCMILGFNQAYYSSAYQRNRIYNLYFDCQSGIWIDNCLDIPRLRDCHGWPFSSIAGGTLTRSGIAYKFTTVGDWNQVIGCFSYGYLTGFLLDGVNSVTLLDCGVDGTAAYAGSTGFKIINGCTDTRLIGCQSAAQDTGVYINTTTVANLHTQLIGHDTWGNINNGVQIDGGDLTILGGRIRNSVNGLAINNSNSIVQITGVRFNALSSFPINAFVANYNTILNSCTYGNLAVGNSITNGSNIGIPSIASASALNLLPSFDNFNVTGSVGISGGILTGWAGRKITLKFAAGLTVTHGGGSGAGIVRLSGGVNFVAGAGATLTLMHDGNIWYEIGRAT